jgi:hypothetical protein
MFYSHLKLKSTDTYSTKWQYGKKAACSGIFIIDVTLTIIMWPLLSSNYMSSVPSRLSHVYRQTFQSSCIPWSMPQHKSVIQRSCPTKGSNAGCNLPSFHFTLQNFCHSFGLVSSSSLGFWSGSMCTDKCYSLCNCSSCPLNILSGPICL